MQNLKSNQSGKQNLHQKFVQLAQQRKNITRQLHDLLPEIDKQQIYKQKGCHSIYEYAWKYAGFSKPLVDKILQVGKHVENLPNLKKTIETQGIHKVGMVATLATPETDRTFAEHVSNMSKLALFEFSKELRHKFDDDSKVNVSQVRLGFVDEDGNSQFNQKCQAVPEKIRIELDDEMQILFLQLKKKLEKEFKAEISHKEALRFMLKRLAIKHSNEKKIAKIKNGEANVSENQKTKISKLISSDQISIPGNGTKVQSTRSEKSRMGTKTKQNVVISKPSRYIPKAKESEILQKYNHKCAYPNCNKPYEVLHHRERFASSKNHESIIPLCKEHHEFMHNGLVENETKNPEEWKLNINSKRDFLDTLFLKYKFC